MRTAALLFACLPLCAQSVTHRFPAGTDARGNPLTVVQKHFPAREPSEKRCVPAEQYLLDQRPLLTLCQTDIPIETEVAVTRNSLAVSRDGGAQAGFNFAATYQLSPWRTLEVSDCSFHGSGEFTSEQFDYRTLRGQAWQAAPDEIDGICVHDAKLFTYLIVPTVPADPRALASARARLGSCALALDASGRNGFVTWGKADAQDPVEIKLLQIGPHTLIAEIIDPQRNTAPAASWVNADHFEIWMGTRGELGGPNSTWQFGIPLDEGPVQVGFGKPPKLPTVQRWKSNTATVLLIELPPQPNDYSDGLTVVYSQSLAGRAQKRMISTSRIKRGDPGTMGSQGSALADNSAGDYVTCDLVNGALDITAGPKTPIELPRPQR